MRASFVLGVVTVVLAGCPKDPQPIQCKISDDCNQFAGGSCDEYAETGNLWCSYPDATCPNGRRWTDTDTGDGIGGLCQMSPDAGAVDGGPSDAAGDISPAIVFVSKRSANADIWRMNPDGTNATNLTSSGAAESAPRWSPSGDRIAFLSDRTGTMELFVMKADGSDVVNVSHGQAFEDAAWSPDGKTLAFSSKRGGSVEIYAAAADGGGAQALTTGGGAAPDWSPDGTRIVFEKGSVIAVMDASGANAVAITTGIDRSPKWRPDGTKIAYSHRVTFSNYDVYTISPNGTSPADVTNSTGTTEFSPQWSPDGAWIAMEGGTDVNPEIYVVGATGTGLVNVSNTAVRDAAPRWSPDSLRIVYQSGDTSMSGSQEVYEVARTGGLPTDLTKLVGDDTEPSYRPVVH